MSFSTVFYCLLATIAFFLNLYSVGINLSESLNSFLCFSRVKTVNSYDSSSVVSITVTGYGFDYYADWSYMCKGNFLKDYGSRFCKLEGADILCNQETIQSRVVYKYNYRVYCESNYTDTDGVDVSITPKVVSNHGVLGLLNHVKVLSSSEVLTCQLSEKFYIIYTSFLIFLFTVTFLLIQLTYYFSPGSYTKIYFNQHLNPLLSYLCSKGMLSFCNPIKNKLYTVNSTKTIRFIGRSEVFPVLLEETNDFHFTDGDRLYLLSKMGDLISVISDDNQGFFKRDFLTSQNSHDFDAIRSYLEFKRDRVVVANQWGHYLTLDEILDELSNIRKVNLFSRVPVMLTFYEPDHPGNGVSFSFAGKTSAVSDLIANHFNEFFGFFSEALVLDAFKSHKKPDDPRIKSSAWKIYLSDLYFHIGKKKTSKTRKAEKSATLLRVEKNDLKKVWELKNIEENLKYLSGLRKGFKRAEVRKEKETIPVEKSSLTQKEVTSMLPTFNPLRANTLRLGSMNVPIVSVNGKFYTEKSLLQTDPTFTLIKRLITNFDRNVIFKGEKSKRFLSLNTKGPEANYKAQDFVNEINLHSKFCLLNERFPGDLKDLKQRLDGINGALDKKKKIKPNDSLLKIKETVESKIKEVEQILTDSSKSIEITKELMREGSNFNLSCNHYLFEGELHGEEAKKVEDVVPVKRTGPEGRKKILKSLENREMSIKKEVRRVLPEYLKGLENDVFCSMVNCAQNLKNPGKSSLYLSHKGVNHPYHPRMRYFRIFRREVNKKSKKGEGASERKRSKNENENDKGTIYPKGYFEEKVKVFIMEKMVREIEKHERFREVILKIYEMYKFFRSPQISIREISSSDQLKLMRREFVIYGEIGELNFKVIEK